MADKLISKKIISLVLVFCFVLVVVVWTSKVSPVWAAPLEQTPSPAKDSALVNEKLEKIYKGLVKMHEAEGDQLKRVKEWVSRLEEQIKKMKENGKDPAKFVKSVDIFKQRLTSAQAAYDKADAILKTHAGFDANGKVTDPHKAYETLKDARNYSFEVQKELRPVLMTMQKRMFEHLKSLLPKK